MYEKLEDLEKKICVTDFPLNVAIEPTNYCNLNCIMCENDQMTRPKGIMDMQLYKKIIDEIVLESPNTRIWLDFYGEPLIAEWKLYDMIDYAKKSGLENICINSNGMLMNKEYADMLLDAGINYISLDCDGFSKEIYESIRVGGDRDVFYKNVEYLLQERARRKEKCIVEIKVIEMDKNRNEVDDILNYWRMCGAWTSISRCSEWVGDTSIKSINNVDQGERIACGHLVGTCAITWDGYIAGCAWDSDCKIKCGNVNESTIKSIWEKRNSELVAVHMQHRWDELDDICINCSNWKKIGEIRYDEQGNEINRSYDLKDKIY